MTVTLINPLSVPEDREDEFLQHWKESSDKLAGARGFIGARLHRNTGAKDQTFLYINVALWESEEAYHAAFRDLPSETQSIPGVEGHAGLFTVAVDMGQFA